MNDASRAVAVRQSLQKADRAGLLAEYVNEVKVAMDLDVIVKCRMSGDYGLGISAEGGASRKLKKAWRIYRYMPALLNGHQSGSDAVKLLKLHRSFCTASKMVSKLAMRIPGGPNHGQRW